MNTQRSNWTTLSATHADRSQRAENPLYERAGQTHREFETQGDPLKAKERLAMQMSEAERRRVTGTVMSKEAFMASRGTSMVERQRSHPVLRPSPKLARGIDAASFDEQWEAERRAAHHALGLKAPMNREEFMTARSSHSKEFNRQRGRQRDKKGR